jgi:hypothetical protein
VTLLLIGGMAILGICVLSLIGLYESHQKVSRLLDELNEDRRKAKNKIDLSLVPSATPSALGKNNNPDANFDIYADVGFTRSLLALSKVRSLDPYGSRSPEPVESSWSESLHPVRSRTRDQVP